MSEYPKCVRTCERCGDVFTSTVVSFECYCSDCRSYRGRELARAERRAKDKTEEVKCYTCGGKGKIMGRTNSLECNVCNGKGYTVEPVQVINLLPGDYTTKR